MSEQFNYLEFSPAATPAMMPFIVGIRVDLNLLYTLSNLISACLKMPGEITRDVSIFAATAIVSAADDLLGYVDRLNKALENAEEVNAGVS